jgi:hypothetical protein
MQTFYLATNSQIPSVFLSFLKIHGTLQSTAKCFMGMGLLNVAINSEFYFMALFQIKCLNMLLMLAVL